MTESPHESIAAGTTQVVSRTQQTLENSRDRLFRALIENASDIVTILGADGTIQYESPAVARVLGFTPEELLGKSAFELVHSDDRPGVLSAFLEVMENRYDGRGFAFRFLHKDGSWRYLELSGTNLLADKIVEGIVVNSHDVTDRNLAQEALRESEERYALALRAANDGLWDWDLSRGTCYFSPRWKEMLGFEQHEISDRPEEWLRLVHPEDKERLDAELRVLLDRRTDHLECQYRIFTKDGSIRHVLTRGLAVSGADKRVCRIVGSLSDITARKQAEDRLQYDALHDGLTGLPNRSLLLDRLQMALARAERHPNYIFAVLFLDVDRFKLVNDSLGHGTGDQMLVEIARLLEKCVRPGDTVARIGGDEFSILVDDLPDRSEAAKIGQRIQDHFLIPFHLGTREIYTSASIGITLHSREHRGPEDLLRDSDIAMYRAKSLGKARFEIFDSSMHTQALQRLELETRLRQAADRGEIEVWYQPIMDIGSGSLEGFEALARWRCENRGIIPPAEFIPVAEETGLIISIGETVLRQACAQLCTWKEQFGREFSMSVNISTRQFLQPDLVARVVAILDATNADPRRLKMEITESAVMGDFETARSTLSQLRELGISVSIDDFGTGYSSLSYLMRLPIDTLKIDKSFVDGMEWKAETAGIVQTIIRLAQGLQLNVVAEGVENQAQLNKLSELNCNQAQGYLFSRPLTVDSMTEFIGSSALSVVPQLAGS